MAYYCKNCNIWWNYPIKKCIYCFEDVQEIFEYTYNVIGFTQVHVPSENNDKVPYFNYLLEDKNGNKIIIKSFQEYQIGDLIDISKEKESINSYSVGVIGTGQMGMGIAEYILRQGHQMIIKTRNDKSTVISKLNSKLTKNCSDEEISKYMANLSVTVDFNDLKSCDIIIEAVSEDFNLKKDVFRKLSEICDVKTIFATNTSSISIDKIASITDRASKVIGMHFFNPVNRMDLIEVIVGKETSEKTRSWITNFSQELGKVPVVAKNSPGFIVNRLLLPQINEAAHLLETGIAGKKDIDTAMKLGLNHPMGPLKLADLIGIDICVSILETMYQDLGDEKFKPTKTLLEMVKTKKLGLKSGEGFYKY